MQDDLRNALNTGGVDKDVGSQKDIIQLIDVTDKEHLLPGAVAASKLAKRYFCFLVKRLARCPH